MSNATFLERAKSQLEWLQHGDLLLRIFGSFGVGTVIRALLAKRAHMDPIWITPLWLGATAVVLAMLMFVVPRWPSKREAGSPQTQIVNRNAEYKNVEEFYATYDNVLLVECETNIRAQIDDYAPGPDRERFMVRLHAGLVLVFLFETIWLNILGSQIQALEQLNRQPCSHDDLRVFYDVAVESDPVGFATFSFEAWFYFLTSQLLVLVQKDFKVGITVRGREFLKYLIQCGRSARDRLF